MILRDNHIDYDLSLNFSKKGIKRDKIYEEK